MPYISVGSVGNTSDKGSLNEKANTLIEKYSIGLKERISSTRYKPKYHSIAEVLKEKYHLPNLNKAKVPNYNKKTNFLLRGVRGNYQKSTGNVLNYKQAERIVYYALNEKLP